MGATAEPGAGMLGHQGLAVVADAIGATALPRLYLVEGPGRLIGYDLAGPITIGRHPDNTIQLLDTGVSKFHLRLVPGRDRVWLEDLGSQNGTLLNGALVDRAQLHDGDEITVGTTRLVFALTRHPRDGRGPAVSMLPTHCQWQHSVATEIPAAADFPPASAFARSADLGAAYEQLRATYEMMRAVASADDLSALAHAVLERGLAQLPAERGALLLRDGAALTPLAVHATAGASEQGDIALPAALVEQVTATRRGLVVAGAPFSAVGSGAAATRSALVVPLVVAGEVLGILYFDARTEASAFGPRQLDILATVARPAALAIANARLCEQVAAAARTRLALERFLSPTLVEQVQQRALALGEQGQGVEATILFADIRGFTALAEPMAAEHVVAMLNEFFERAVDVVFRHDGVLDKYIGDALMAVWGVPAPAPDHARRALRAAVELRAAVAELNQARQARGEAPLPIGIGLASGPVVAGLVGAPRRLEFTAVGDTVNVASRLCALAAGGEILAADSVLQACGDDVPFAVVRQGARALKGKARPLQVASVQPLAGDG